MANMEYYADVKVNTGEWKMYAVTYRFTMSLQQANVIDQHYSLGPYKLAPGHEPVWRTNSVMARYIHMNWN